MTSSPFRSLGLAEPLLRALDAQNFHTPTPIQAEAIPPLLAGRDLLGIAQTGTGKTLAFGLPLLHHLAADRRRAPQAGARALVLAPTRELAIQIEESLRGPARAAGLRTFAIFGGVGRFPQVQRMARGVDLVVGTPGRIVDLMGTRELRLDAVTHFVLDEADRMLDLGFIRDIRRVVAALPAARQSMLFSATMPAEVAGLAEGLLRDPLRVEVSRQDVVPNRIDQHVYFVDTTAKRTLLGDLLADPAITRAIVFTRTKHGANRVAEHLCRTGHPAEAIHGNKSQSARQRSLDLFRRGEARVLVATDIAARGIDVTGISHVVNFDLPNEPESYVHRIGRTARAGADGIALSFCDASERPYLRAIEKLTGERLNIVGPEPDWAREPRQAVQTARSRQPRGRRPARFAA